MLKKGTAVLTAAVLCICTVLPVFAAPVQPTVTQPTASQAEEELSTEPDYIIVENDPDATEPPGEEASETASEDVSADESEAASGTEDKDVSEDASEEEPTEPPIPDALNESGMLLTLISSEAQYGYRIIIPVNCADETSYAAGVLQSVLQKMTGVLLPIYSDDTEEQPREICVGNTNRTTFSLDSVSENGYVLLTEGEKLFLCGMGTRGALRCVNVFLHRYCGCSWFAANEIRLPVVQTLQIPAHIDVRGGDFFTYAEVYSSHTNAEFLLHNALTGGAYTPMSADGSSIPVYLTACEDTLTTRFVNTQENEYAENCFALVNGVRDQRQLCLSSWDTYSAVLQEMLTLLHYDWAPNAKKQVICLSVPDNGIVCTCADCSQLTALNQSASGVLITFLNRLSAGIAAAGYSNISLETTIRGVYLQPPVAVTPAANLIFRVYSDTRCLGHALTDSACIHNRVFTDILRRWFAFDATVYVDMPTENKAHTIGIFPAFSAMQQDMQTLYYLGADGVCAADDPLSADCGAELRALRTYLIACLLADPYCNIQEEQRLFLQSWYGAGGEAVEEIVNILTEHAGDADGHLFVRSTMQDSLTLTDAQITHISELWQRAKEASADGRELLHTEQSEIAWRFYLAGSARGVFAQDGAVQAKRILIDDLKTAGVSRYSTDNETLNVGILSVSLQPQEWNTPLPDLLTPVFQTVEKCLFAVLLAAMFMLFLAAVVRRRPFYLLPVWGCTAALLILPWHLESIVGEDVFSSVLTLVVLLLQAGLFGAFSEFAKGRVGRRIDFVLLAKLKIKEVKNKDTSDSEFAAVLRTQTTAKGGAAEKKIVRKAVAAGLIAAAVTGLVYGAVLSAVWWTQFTAAQLVYIALLIPSVLYAAGSVLLLVRFLKYR